MAIFKTILLGILQGLTEYLPVSSTGHLLIAQRLLGMPETNLMLEVVLHVGTLIPVLYLFWDDWRHMFLHPVKDRSLRLLAIATVPMVLLTLLTHGKLAQAYGGQYMGWCLLFGGAILISSDFLWRRAIRERIARKRMRLDDMRITQAVAMGAMQALSIAPGIPLYGVSATIGLAMGIPRRAAVKCALMMGAFATTGSLVYKLPDLIRSGGATFEGGWIAALCGMAVACLCGFLIIRWVVKIIRRISLQWFGVYTLLLGILVLVDQLFTGYVMDKIV